MDSIYHHWLFLINPIASTGFPVDILEEIYLKYCGPLTPIPTRSQLARLFSYYKNYCPIRFHSTIYGLSSSRSFHAKLKISEDYLASVVDEMQEAWTQRLRPTNLLPFPRIFTNRTNIKTVLDTFPVRINRPINNQRIFYSGKYKAHCVKFQALADLEGNIVWYSGPHPGSTHDKRLLVEYPPPLERWEQAMADLAYVGEDCKRIGCITGYKRPRAGALTRRQKTYNDIFAHFRVRVEHSFAFLKRFNILSGKYRGKSYMGHDSKLGKVVRILVNCQYMYTRRYPLRALDLSLYD